MNTTTRNTRSRAVVPVVVIGIAALLITLVISLQQPSTTTAPPASTETATPAASASSAPDLTMFEIRSPEDPLTAGPTDAPVGLVIFSDYQCPYCARWSTDTLPVMMRYAEQGDLRIEWRDLNIFGDESIRASRAAYAAALQGKFWEYHDALFPDGGTRSKDRLSEAALIELAVEFGLDEERFVADLGSEETAAAVDTYAQLGRALGASSTPVFLLGGTPIVGAQPTEVFVQAFETALAAQRD